jgi:hypothetical protein
MVNLPNTATEEVKMNTSDQSQISVESKPNEIAEIPLIKSNKNSYLPYLDKLNELMIIFVNPKSGSEEGKIFLELAEKYKDGQSQNFNVINFNEFTRSLIWSLKKEKTEKKSKNEKDKSSIYNTKDSFIALFINIIDQDEYERGCDILSEYLSYCDSENKIKVLVGGGDGTILSTIEHLYSKKINIDKCIFGHIPLGTGNDLANALGFGSKKYNNLLNSI